MFEFISDFLIIDRTSKMKSHLKKLEQEVDDDLELGPMIHRPKKTRISHEAEQ